MLGKGFYTDRSATCKRLCAVGVADGRTVPEKVLLCGAPKMPLEPLHHCGIGALEIGGSGAREAVFAPLIRMNDAGTPALVNAAYIVSP